MFFILNSCYTFVTTNTEINIYTLQKIKIMLQKLNFTKLQSLSPTILSQFKNKRGQEIQLIEHPIYGEEHPVIIMFLDYKVAFNSEFWDTEDIYKTSDYEPFLKKDKNGEFQCLFAYELR